MRLSATSLRATRWGDGAARKVLSAWFGQYFGDGGFCVGIHGFDSGTVRTKLLVMAA